jgi:single-strand DNA-binding protein
MNDTYVTVSGIVVKAPRAAVIDGTLPVTSFRMVSTSRRWDRGANSWVDGNTLWVTVTCWRQLALNARTSVLPKDRVVVYGRLKAPEWTDPKTGQRRNGMEIDAESLGHDLTFGTSVFTRGRRSEPVELPGQREANELARAVELDTMGADLAALLGPDELEDGELVGAGVRGERSGEADGLEVVRGLEEAELAVSIR